MASKQLWRWHGITGDGNRKMGCYGQRAVLYCLWHYSKDGYPTKPEANRHQFCAVARNKSAEVIHQLATLLKAGLTLLKGWLCWRNSIPVSNGKRC